MIFTIFKKELKETLRDKKTIMSMVVIPMLLFPIIFSVFYKVEEGLRKSLDEKTLNIGYVGQADEYLTALKSLPKQLGKRKLIAVSDTNALKAKVKKGDLQMGLFFPANFNELAKESKSIALPVFYKSSEIGIATKISTLNQAVFSLIQQQRFQTNQINPQSVTPYIFQMSDTATKQETIGNLVGGFLPYIFIVFGFVGCMYPCIDLFTGEKERGTFETLLTAPVTRWQIMLGKMGVVVLSGFMAAFFTLVGIFLSVNVLGIIKDPEISEVIHQMFNSESVIMLLLLLLPLIILFAGVMIPIAMNAKTFKEAQSIITPLNILFIMIAVIGMIPGININLWTACLPVVNVVLGMKALLAGSLNWLLLGISFIIMVAIAFAAIMISYRKFDDERNIVI